jgi:hypothetical protein
MKRRRHTPSRSSAARRGEEVARAGTADRGALQTPRDHRVDLPPLVQSVRRHEGRRREAPERPRTRKRSVAKLVGDEALDVDMLKEPNRGTF